jgi:hypothetical protein
MMNDDVMNIEGKWTYRSYHNLPDPSKDDRWGIYELTLKQDVDGFLEGKLDSGSPEEVYTVQGKIHNDGTRNADSKDKCFNINMIATGATNQTAGHEYRYLGRIIPKWQTGKNQRTAFIGTNIRTKYPGNPSQEGVVGCFVATKKDSDMQT